MLPHHQPSDVCEEEAPLGIVGVSIGLRILVMRSVISDPLQNVVLESKSVQNHENHSQDKMGLVGAMGPQPVSTYSYSEASQDVQYKGKEYRPVRRLEC